MEILYLNDQTKSFPNKVNEIIFLGAIYPKGKPYATNEGVHIGYSKEKLEEVNETMVSGKVSSESYPAFNGDIINKVKTNNFYLKKMITAKTGNVKTHDKKGRVTEVGGKAEIGNDNIANINFNVMTFSKFKLLPDGGYDIREFIPDIDTNKYILTNRPNIFNKPLRLNKIVMEGDNIVSEANIVKIHQPVFSGEAPIARTDVKGINEDTLDIRETYDCGMTPWIYQRNFNNSPNTFAGKTPTLETFPINAEKEGNFTQVVFVMKGHLITTRKRNNRYFNFVIYKIKPDGVVDFENPVVQDIPGLRPEGTELSYSRQLSYKNGHLLISSNLVDIEDGSTFRGSIAGFFDVKSNGEIVHLNNRSGLSNATSGLYIRDHVFGSTLLNYVMTGEPGQEEYSGASYGISSSSVPYLPSKLGNSSSNYLTFTSGKYIYIYNLGEQDENGNHAMRKSKIDGIIPYGGWSTYSFPIKASWVTVAYAFTTRRNVFLFLIYRNAQNRVVLEINEFAVSLTTGELTYTGITNVHDIHGFYNNLPDSFNHFITSSRLYLFSVGTLGVKALSFPFSGGKNDYDAESYTTFRLY